MDAMGTLQRYLAQIKNQLAGLTMSQKLLIGTLTVIMIGIVFGVITYSAKPEMVELLPGNSWTAEDIGNVKAHLDGRHRYEMSGNQILVPAEQAFEIRGELAAEQALPKDTTLAFAKLADANDFMRTDRSNERLWNYAKQEVLTKVIKNFPYIADATVIISQGERTGLGHAGVPSSAMVTVKTKSGDSLSNNQVMAIVETVHGATSGMKREDVHVTDGARAYHVPSEDDVTPTDLLSAKKLMEDELSTKLMQQFSYIPNAKVSVNVIIDMSSRKSSSKIYDSKPVKVETNSTSKETSTTDGSGGGSQPGVMPNVAINTGATSANHGSSSTTSDSTSTVEVRFPEKVEERVLPAGTELVDMTASISFPRSYFEKIYQLRIAKDPKALPDDATLQPVITDYFTRLRSLAKNVIGAKTDDQIRIDYFDDTISAPAIAAMSGGEIASAASIGNYVNLYAKQGVLFMLAAGALGLMFVMARRAAPAGDADIDTSVFATGSTGGGRRRKGETGDMNVGDDVYGEANEGDAVLTGIELDDETLKSRKMVDEVSTMIKDNPENAASLVKRWLTKGK
jgi:flagellar biosynthesis/type III secretory pathway M-ring protein FliF/YscJ